ASAYRQAPALPAMPTSPMPRSPSWCGRIRIARSASVRHTHHHGHGAVIGRLVIGHAPVNVVMNAHLIARALALIGVAFALAAARPAAAISIADQIVLLILAVEAGAHPADLRHFRARRAFMARAAAAAAQHAVQRAVLPV